MDNSLVVIWAWLAIWLPWIWVATWLSMGAVSSMDVLWKNPKIAPTLLVYTILWLAIIESIAIFWLLVAFQIIGKEWLDWSHAIWACLAIWLTWLWAWLWEWKLVSETLQAINRNPENKKKVLQFMMLFLTLVEATAVYGFIVALQLLK